MFCWSVWGVITHTPSTSLYPASVLTHTWRKFFKSTLQFCLILYKGHTMVLGYTLIFVNQSLGSNGIHPLVSFYHLQVTPHLTALYVYPHIRALILQRARPSRSIDIFLTSNAKLLSRKAVI